jgi:hypothetical protein
MIEIQQFPNKHIQIFEGLSSTIKGQKKINIQPNAHLRTWPGANSFILKYSFFLKKVFQGGALELDFLEQLTGVGLRGALVRGGLERVGKKKSPGL